MIFKYQFIGKVQYNMNGHAKADDIDEFLKACTIACINARANIDSKWQAKAHDTIEAKIPAEIEE